jgi:molybdenum cofactor biosynthesis protein B
MSYEEHSAQARYRPVRCAIITVSDSRTLETDRSGTLMQTRLTGAGHEIAFYQIVPDEPERIASLLDGLAGTAEVILFSGGTGVSRRDTTYEALAGKLEKTLPGFGELFRMLSYQEIGSGAMLSRATAGVYRDMVVFSMPGSLNAVKLALDRLILPELRHLVWEIARQQA